ncbi:MAG: hypothetical protein HC901_02570, partial [Bdellovibrionaceae bacterium]|nr:hypothetical protein [Pseudobdellovibrionaceae bacterium]
MIPLNDLADILLGGCPATLPPALAAMDADERLDLHTATFDLNPVCNPYAGIHLFGEENFKRGELMAGLAHRMSAFGLDPRPELPDHLANLLRLLPLCPEDEAAELATFCILGPLGRMAASLPEENPYREILDAAQAAIGERLPGVIAAPNPMDQMRAAGRPACAPDA